MLLCFEKRPVELSSLHEVIYNKTSRIYGINRPRIVFTVVPSPFHRFSADYGNRDFQLVVPYWRRFDSSIGGDWNHSLIGGYAIRLFDRRWFDSALQFWRRLDGVISMINPKSPPSEGDFEGSNLALYWLLRMFTYTWFIIFPTLLDYLCCRNNNSIATSFYMFFFISIDFFKNRLEYA